MIECDYGVVYIADGEHKGRIGLYDDDHSIFSDEKNASFYKDVVGWRNYEDEDDGKIYRVLDLAIVYFGNFFLSEGYFYIPHSYLRSVTTDDLLRRREDISKSQGLYAMGEGDSLSSDEKLDLFRELHYIESILVNRMVEARYSNSKEGAKVFISHSSKDKSFAKWVATDLKAAGHTPWLDEWEISIGESIPAKISEGLSSCDFIIVVLSRHSVESTWVEREWQTKYWHEVSSGKVNVLPVVYEECNIPELLKTKKYANFQNNYNNGLEDVLRAIDHLYDFSE